MLTNEKTLPPYVPATHCGVIPLWPWRSVLELVMGQGTADRKGCGQLQEEMKAGASAQSAFLNKLPKWLVYFLSAGQIHMDTVEDLWTHPDKFLIVAVLNFIDGLVTNVACLLCFFF